MDKPLLIFDGDCEFCKQWIGLWENLTAGRVQYAPSQKVSHQFPQISLERYDQSVVLVFPSGEIFYGAEAVFRSLSYAPDFLWGKRLLACYQRVPGFAGFSEFFYSLVARNRTFFSHLTSFFFFRKRNK